jgi:hypothetical protein
MQRELLYLNKYFDRRPATNPRDAWSRMVKPVLYCRVGAVLLRHGCPEATNSCVITCVHPWNPKWILTIGWLRRYESLHATVIIY